MSQLTSSDFTAYPGTVTADDAITAGPNALYTVSLDQILPTQINEGLTEVGKKAAGFDLLTSQAELTANLLTDIEPVVIGPDGTLYLLDGHHTFTALADSVFGASDPTVYVDIVANYSSLSETAFFQTLQSSNLLLPLNDGVPETVNDATGAPIPTSLTSLTSDPYRGLEYSILKNKSSKLFTTTNNITGAVGAATPGLDKMTGFYSDFLEAAAYRDANGGKGLPFLSPGDIALATQWNLTATNLTTLPNVTGTVEVGQLPGYILNNNGAAANIIITGVVSNSTLANGALDGTKTGTFDETTTFASFNGITEINAGTVANPIIVGTPNVGFIMQLGADDGGTVTLSNAANTYTGGTSLLAGTLIVSGDGSLGAAPTESNSGFTSSLTIGAAGVPTNVKSAVQADNGIIFNGLTEGNPILQIGTTSGGGTATFATSRPIAVGGEVATLNLNDYIVTLNGQLISLGVDGDGVGNATGFADITFDDLSSAGTGKVILSTASPYFYGNIIVGNTGTPIVDVMNDAALGNTTGPADMIGEVELNGGTLQTGASFTATERNLFLGGGSSFDVDGNTTSWGTITDVQRTLEILNSNATTAGAVTFNNLTISATAILQLAGGAAGETVTLTNGIVRTGADTLIIQPSSTTSLGTTEKVFSGTGTASLVNTIAPVWIVENNDVSKGAGPYDFVTYGANGYVKATYDSTATLNSSTSADVVALSGNATLAGNASVYALNTEGKTVTLGSNTLTIGDGTDAAGLILATGSAITGGTLAFGASEGVIWLSGTNPTISSQITGSGGLTFSGSGTVAISTAANVAGAITIDSGTVNLAAVNVFANDAAGVLLDNTKTKPSAANLTISANNQFTSLNSVGNNSTITIKNGSVLTIGDSNNQSSTLSSAITDTTLTAGAITTAGTGLVDLSGATVTLAAGSSIFATGGQLRVATGALKNTAVAASAPNFVLSNNADLQFAQNGGGQYAGAISGVGTLHLIGGTLQLIGTGNTYSGGTIVETGSILDVTTANLPTINENITDAGGLVVFDQDTSGNYTGVISDGLEMGTGPTMSGSLDIDDSAATNASNADVTLLAAQTYTGATYVEAGTLTLNVTNAIADSSGLTLGRVGGAIDSQTANLVLHADNALTSLSDDASNTTSVVLNGHVLTLSPTITSVSSFSGTISDGTTHGSLVVDGVGTVTLSGNNTFSGGITIDAGTLELAHSNSAGTGDITFVDPPTVARTLKIDLEADPQNTISGFSSNGDTIDLVGFDGAATSANMNYSTDVLTVTDDLGNSVTLNFTGDFSGEFFHAAASSDGADITENNVACYCFGTLIHTPRGRTRVENLKIGDKVKTASGAARPIKWIGRRSYGGRFILGQKDILPICIRAGALGDGVPRRDLWISPHHAMYLQGVLIEARDLVNGVSIVQAESVDKVEYFHIELDTHDVIIANGALSETFIDDDSRCMFHNVHEYAALYPDAQSPAAQAQYCAPRHSDGYAVEAARAHIAQRAALRPALPVTGELRGFIDHAGGKRILGWAQNADHPEAPVCLDVYVGGRLIGQVLANRYREDLKTAGLGSGSHSFEFVPPASFVFDPAAIEVRRSLDGAGLARSGRSRRAA